MPGPEDRVIIPVTEYSRGSMSLKLPPAGGLSMCRSLQAVEKRPKDHRKCVGIVLLNAKNEAFVACRSDLTVAQKVLGVL